MSDTDSKAHNLTHLQVTMHHSMAQQVDQRLAELHQDEQHLALRGVLAVSHKLVKVALQGLVVEGEDNVPDNTGEGGVRQRGRQPT